jgi:hypothetical protein
VLHCSGCCHSDHEAVTSASDPTQSIAVPNWAPESRLSALPVVKIKSRMVESANADGFDGAQQ